MFLSKKIILIALAGALLMVSMKTMAQPLSIPGRQKVYVSGSSPKIIRLIKQALLRDGYWEVTDDSAAATLRLQVTMSHWGINDRKAKAMLTDVKNNQTVYTKPVYTATRAITFAPGHCAIKKLVRKRIRPYYS